MCEERGLPPRCLVNCWITSHLWSGLVLARLSSSGSNPVNVSGQRHSCCVQQVFNVILARAGSTVEGDFFDHHMCLFHRFWKVVGKSVSLLVFFTLWFLWQLLLILFCIIEAVSEKILINEADISRSGCMTVGPLGSALEHDTDLLPVNSTVSNLNHPSESGFVWRYPLGKHQSCGWASGCGHLVALEHVYIYPHVCPLFHLTRCC